MSTIHFAADTVARSKQLEMHHRTSQMANQVMDAVRGRIRDLRLVPRTDDLEVHGVCDCDNDVSAVLESAKRVLGTNVRISNMLVVIQHD